MSAPEVTDRLTDRQYILSSDSDDEYTWSDEEADIVQRVRSISTSIDVDVIPIAPLAAEVEIRSLDTENHNNIQSSTPLLEEVVFSDARIVGDTSRFRLNNQRVLLTYSQIEMSKVLLEDFIKTKVAKQLAKHGVHPRIKIALETHKDGGKHMHALCDFGHTFETRNCRFFDYDGLVTFCKSAASRHPNIRIVKDTLHWANLLIYIGKEDKENKASPAVTACALIWQQKSPSEALICGASTPHPITGKPMPMRVTDILAIYDNKPQKGRDELPEPHWKWYQDTLLPIIKGKSDHRSWHWFCDKEGNTGKSYCCRYLSRYHKDDVRCTKLTSTADNLCYKILAWQQAGWTGKIMLIDLPRAKEDREHIYGQLEILGDGWGDTGKYRGGEFDLAQSPIVIIFANWWPRFKGTGSSDRWKLYKIVKNNNAGKIVEGNDEGKGIVTCSALRMNLNIVRAERRADEAAEAALTPDDDDYDPKPRKNFNQHTRHVTQY